MNEFKNKHQGETAYIIGSGPTVNKFTNKISDQGIIIGCNQSYFNPFVCANMDYLFTEGCYKYVVEQVQPHTIIFYMSIPSDLESKQYLKYLRENPNAYELNNFESLNYTALLYATKGASSMAYVATMLAVLLGCSNLYLVGMDCSTTRFYKHPYLSKEANFSSLLNGWIGLKKYFKDNYPHITLSVINPVALKSIFPTISSTHVEKQ